MQSKRYAVGDNCTGDATVAQKILEIIEQTEVQEKRGHIS